MFTSQSEPRAFSFVPAAIAEGSFLSDTNGSSVFSSFLCTHALPLCDIPLCGERESERETSRVEERALQTAYITLYEKTKAGGRVLKHPMHTAAMLAQRPVRM